MYRKTLLTVVIATFSTLALADLAADYVPEARQQMMKLGKNLKGELQMAMKSGGPLKALGVCNIKAPEIAKQVSEGSNWTVARTSLKLRNPNNKPTAWEKMVLLSFEERKVAGEDPKKIDHAEIVEEGSSKTFRYMKAIPTAKVCLNCHGAQVKPEVEARIKELYPTDKARGYQLGDIRGAFTLSMPL